MSNYNNESAARIAPAGSGGQAAQPEPGEFRVSAPPEVQALLRQLLDDQARVTLASSTGAQLTARLCALETEHGAIGFDVAPRDPQVQALLGADEVSATAYLDLVRVAFELEGLVLVNDASGAVLRAALPPVLHRFQRRQAFRVKPNTRTPQARLMLAGAQGAEQRLRIVDLSVGGIALLLPPGEIAPPEEGGEIEAWVELDRDNHFPALLRLQHVNSAGDPVAGSPPPDTRLGFAWASIDPVALRAVQLFIDQTQKLNRLLRKT